MEARIKGRRYDTVTAKMILDYYNNEYCFDSGQYHEEAAYRETLYKKRTGEFFLHARGGCRSKYSGLYNHAEVGCDVIIPLDEDAAIEWVVDHFPEEFRNVFGDLMHNEGVKKYVARHCEDAYIKVFDEPMPEEYREKVYFISIVNGVVTFKGAFTALSYDYPDWYPEDMRKQTEIEIKCKHSGFYYEVYRDYASDTAKVYSVTWTPKTIRFSGKGLPESQEYISGGYTYSELIHLLEENQEDSYHLFNFRMHPETADAIGRYIPSDFII